MQLTQSLAVNEKGTINPTVNWLPSPATAVFHLAGGLNTSADATRVNKMNAYHLVKVAEADAFRRIGSGGLFLMQNDPKLSQ